MAEVISISNLNKRKVVQADRLIKATHNASVNGLKIFCSMVSMIHREDGLDTMYWLPIGTLLEIFGVKNKSLYKELHEATDKLASVFAVIPNPDGSLSKLPLLQEAKHVKGRIGVTPNPKLKPYLLDLKKDYTVYELGNITRLKRYASIKLYQTIIMYSKNTNSFTLSVDELKEVLEIENGMYPLFGNLKQKLVEPSQKEIIEKTDVKFDIKYIKESRKITKVRFYNIERAVKEKVEQLSLLAEVN